MNWVNGLILLLHSWWWPNSSLRIVNQQSGWHWNVFTQPLAFNFTFVPLLRQTHYLDLPGMLFALRYMISYWIFPNETRIFSFAEYINMFMLCCGLQIVSFWSTSFNLLAKWIPHVKNSIEYLCCQPRTLFFSYFFVYVGRDGHCPDFCYDQLMNLDEDVPNFSIIIISSTF